MSATAKTGTWKSKEFEHESLPKMVLVLDAHTSGYFRPPQFELAVSTAASLLEFGARERISMGLCTMGKTLRYFPPAEGYLERQQMLHHLVDIDADGFGNYKDRLEAKPDLFQPGAFFILISPLADDKVLAMLRLAKSRQMIPYHIQIGDEAVAAGAPNTYQTVKRSAWQATLQERGLRGIYVSSLRELPAAMGVRSCETYGKFSASEVLSELNPVVDRDHCHAMD